MKISNKFTKALTITSVVAALTTSLPLGVTFAATDGPVEPAVPAGISILPLDQHPVPDVLKNQTKLELSQMKSCRYI